jgi:O-antigen/teichoic acid export membrane protein
MRLGMSRFDAGARPSNMILRVATLGSRFVLTIYLAHSLSIEDLGIFGLVMGLVGVVPPVTGWGVNYYLGREVVGRTLDDAAVIVRDRLAITLLSLLAIAPLVPLLYVINPGVLPARLALVSAIVVAETISADLQTPLISLGMSLFANVLLFVRSSGWVLVYVGLSVTVPKYRTLDAALCLWLAFDLIQFVLLYVVVLRRIDLGAVFSTPLRIRPLLASIRSALSIYANDVGTAGLVYLDRYFVAAILGLHELGIFTLYWSMTTGVYALISSGIVQPATPLLVHAHATESREVTERLLTNVLINTVAAGVILSAGTTAFAFLALTYLQIGDFDHNYPLFLLLLLATTLRSLSDAISLALASRHMDHAYAIAGIGGMLLSTPLNIAGLSLFGLTGVALSACTTHAAVAWGKWRMLRKVSPRSHHAQSA